MSRGPAMVVAPDHPDMDRAWADAGYAVCFHDPFPFLVLPPRESYRLLTAYRRSMLLPGWRIVLDFYFLDDHVPRGYVFPGFVNDGVPRERSVLPDRLAS